MFRDIPPKVPHQSSSPAPQEQESKQYLTLSHTGHHIKTCLAILALYQAQHSALWLIIDKNLRYPRFLPGLVIAIVDGQK